MRKIYFLLITAVLLNMASAFSQGETMSLLTWEQNSGTRIISTECAIPDYNTNQDESNRLISEVKKIPKIVTSRGGEFTFHYDNQNRVIKIDYLAFTSQSSDATYTITYNPDGTIASHNYDRHNSTITQYITYEYSNDTIFVNFNNFSKLDTLIVNNNGQLLKEHWYKMSYEYDSAGNLIKIIANNPTETLFVSVTLSNIKSSWRYVNMPEWFYTVCGNSGFCLGSIDEAKNGLIPLQSNWDNGELFRKYTYEIDADGYLQKKILEEYGTSGGSLLNRDSMKFEYAVIEVGIEDVEFIAINVYPNPTSGELRIESGEWKIKNFEIFDLCGRIQNVKFSTEGRLDISHLSAGIYFVKISTEAGKVVKKVLKE